MENINDEQLRQQAQNNAKEFKTSWMELGRTLHSVWKEKLFKSWGFMSFETYSFKELGINKNTAAKLVKSYLFLETKEPQYLKKEYIEEADSAKIPSYESINVLRRAKNNKEVTEKEYEKLKKDVFEKGREHREVAKELTTLIRERETKDPETAKMESRLQVLKRFVANLKAAKREMETLDLVPKKLLKEAETLISEIETCF